MNRKAIYLILLSILLLSGCASLNGNVPFQYQPSLTASDNKIDKTAGMVMLKDNRPKDDVDNTKSIKDLPEKVTAKLLEDFKDSEIFTEIHNRKKAEDDLVISGTINRFKWKATPSPLSFIPILSLLQIFGAPTYTIKGEAEITLKIKDNKTGKILKSFTEASEATNTYNMYNFKAGDAGAELSEAFRDVAKQLKEDILKKLELDKTAE
ncbi:MAG: hypothetical protein PHV60_09950 [bacterium]|nr:hypothetical protein [bacterium]